MGEPGELVSLLAVNGPAEGVTTEGLAYPLRGETLEPGSTRGVSNVFAAEARHRADRPGRPPRDPAGRRQVTSCYKCCGRALAASRHLVTSCCKGSSGGLAALVAVLAVAGCGGGGQPKDVVLVTHDAFAISPAGEDARSSRRAA